MLKEVYGINNVLIYIYKLITRSNICDSTMV